jgi:hypothetical protein
MISSFDKKKSALIIGKDDHLVAFLPDLLSKAGFEVDFLGHEHSFLKSSLCLRHFFAFKPPKSIAEQALTHLSNNYDWIIIGDDPTLGEIANSPLDEATKLKLLPVISIINFQHIFSKINLSKVLQKENICTPDFKVISNLKEATSYFYEVKKPLFFKKDRSAGGLGSFLCKNIAEIEALTKKINEEPLLAQVAIDGSELHIDALFLDGKLIFFDAAEVIQRISSFGPTSLLKQIVNSNKHHQLRKELESIGKALGLHCFTNISCIQEHITNKRYYIEVDARPTVWSAYPKDTKKDLARKIYTYFNPGKLNDFKEEVNFNHEFIPEYKVIPCFLRVPFWYFITNEYNVWKYLKTGEPFIVLKFLIKKHLISKMEFIAKIPSRFIERPLRKIFKKVVRVISSF